MADFSLLRSAPPLAKLGLFVLLSGILLIGDNRHRPTERGWLLTLVYPVQVLARTPGRLWSNTRESLRDRSALA